MQAAQETFISSTSWTERTGPAAAIATIKYFIAHKVHEHLVDMGEQVQKGWSNLAKKNGLKIEVGGLAPISHFSFEYEKPLVLKTLIAQEMLALGFLATTAYYASYAHKSEHVKAYLDACDKTFALIADALKKGDPEIIKRTCLSFRIQTIGIK